MTNKYDTKNNLQASISYLRIFATLCVIWIHTCSTLYKNPEIFFLTEGQKAFYSFGYQIMDWSVPVFFMITGALLLKNDKVITWHDVIFKYTRRIIFALLVFGFPMALLKEFSNVDTSLVKVLGKAFYDVLTNNSLSHLWYLYDLVGLYLITPLLKAALNKLSNNSLRAILGLLFLFDYVIATFFPSIAFHIPLGYQIFYYLCGYYFFNVQKKINSRSTIVAFILLPTLILLISACSINKSFENIVFSVDF